MPIAPPQHLHDGKLQLPLRNGIWQARVYLGGRRYLWRSLRTVDLIRAKELGTKLFYEAQYKLQAGLPTHQRSFDVVINEYVQRREHDNAQGNRCRRLAKDWENLSRTALAFLHLASIRLMMRRLCQN